MLIKMILRGKLFFLPLKQALQRFNRSMPPADFAHGMRTPSVKGETAA